MPTTASTIPRSPVDAINSLSPGDRRVLNENELAQRWGLSPKTLHVESRAKLSQASRPKLSH